MTILTINIDTELDDEQVEKVRELIEDELGVQIISIGVK